VAKKQAEKHPLMLDGHAWDREAVMQIVCDVIATSSRSLGRILADGHDGNTLPGHTAIMQWLGEDATLADKYARAKEAQADWMADEMIEIADDGRRDQVVDPETGRISPDHDHISRARLRVDTRKWLASKLRPKKYGERTTQEITGPGGGPLAVSATLTDEQLMAIAAGVAKK
jgi:hypothetical protein